MRIPTIRWLVPMLLGFTACNDVPELTTTPGIAYDIDTSGSFGEPGQFAPATLEHCKRIADAGSALWQCESTPGLDDTSSGAEGVLVELVFLRGFFGRPGELRQMGSSFLVTRVEIAREQSGGGSYRAQSAHPFEGELTVTLQHGDRGHLEGWLSSGLLVLNIDTVLALPPPPAE